MEEPPSGWCSSTGADHAVAAFWERADAVAQQAARRAVDPSDSALVQQVVVQGGRRTCRLCGEPVVMDDPSDPMSWIHAEDANDHCDHTAEV